MRTARIDALIDEHIMGLKRVRLWEDSDPYGWDIVVHSDSNFGVPEYTTNIADAWLVVEKLRADGMNVLVKTYSDGFIVEVFDHATEVKYVGFHKRTAMALCEAALKAKGVEIPDEN